MAVAFSSHVRIVGHPAAIYRDSGARASRDGLRVVRVPVGAVDVPALQDDGAFDSTVARAAGNVQDGYDVVIDGRDAVGRSGMVAACVLVATGLGVDRAIAAVRSAAPGSLDGEEQERYVRTYADRTATAR